MNPTPFGLTSIYPLFVIVAALVGLLAAVPPARRAGLTLPSLLLVQAIMAAAGFLGAVVYNLIEAGSLHRFGWDVFRSSGLRYPGGLLAVMATLPLVARLLPPRLSLTGYLDVIAPSIAFAMAVMRVGCVMMGCCYGVTSSVPWALSFPPPSQAARQHAINDWVAPGAWSLPVHPLQIYFGFASLAVGLALVWYRPRKRYDGQVFLLFLLLHEGAKGGLEFLRGAVAQHSVVHLRIASLTIAAVAGAALAVQRLRLRPGPAEPVSS